MFTRFRALCSVLVCAESGLTRPLGNFYHRSDMIRGVHCRWDEVHLMACTPCMCVTPIISLGIRRLPVFEPYVYGPYDSEY